MQAQGRKTVIGAFVVGAAALLIGGVLLLGSGTFFGTVRSGVLYFDEAVTGLTIGSPVQLLGVKVGQVTDIQLLVRNADLDSPQGSEDVPFQTRVIFDFYRDAILAVDPQGRLLSAAAQAKIKADADPNAMIKKLIARGLRAQLMVQSMVTGQLIVALDFHQDTPVRLSGLAGDLPELPTVPSSGAKLRRTLDSLPLEEIATDLRNTVQGIDRLVNAKETKETMGGLKESAQNLSQVLAKLDKGVDPLIKNSEELLSEVRGLVKRIDERVAPLADNLDGVLGDARKVMGKVDAQVEPVGTRLTAATDAATRALSEITVLLSSFSSLEPRRAGLSLEIRNALRSVSGAMDALKTLGSYLQEHPESLLQGKPGN